MIGVERLDRIVLNASDAARLATFYVDVLGFERIAPRDGVQALALGTTRLDLRQIDGGQPYPAGVAGWSPLFQHFAIVVSDPAAAMAALRSSSEWTAISTDGPERLPANTGHVTAFKFRDPDGHPLELLAPATRDRAAIGDRPFERIDHSAISVADVDRSVSFYAALGLVMSARTVNRGIEQQRLDAIDRPEVDVVSLAVPSAVEPHVELLHYRGPYARGSTLSDPADVATTTLVFEVADRRTLSRLVAYCGAHAVESSSATHACLRDPDGHRIELECTD